jgi:azurin
MQYMAVIVRSATSLSTPHIYASICNLGNLLMMMMHLDMHGIEVSRACAPLFIPVIHTGILSLRVALHAYHHLHWLEVMILGMR